MDWRRFIEVVGTGTPDPWWYTVHHGGGGKGAQPNYEQAAERQGAASQSLATQNTWANRPTVNTPWGQQSWQAGTKVDPATGQTVTDWTQNITLSPEQQAAQQAQTDITQGRSEAAKTLLGQATGAFETPFDWNNLPATPGSVSEAQKGAYSTMSAALEPGRERQRSAQETRLANMGLPMDSRGYKTAQQDLADQFSQQDKGVMAQALSEGRADIGAQQGLRSAALGEQMQRRNMPLNELNALLTGQQVGMPQMPSFAPAGQGQAPDLLQAAGMQGQANAAMRPDWGSLIGSGAGIGALAMAGMF